MRTALLFLVIVGCGGGSATSSTATTVTAVDPRVLEDLGAEALSYLVEIARREESFRSEFDCYAASSTELASGTAHVPDPPWSPAVIARDGAEVTWAPALPGWGEMGFSPGETVGVQLRVAVGPPGTTPPGGGPDDDFWFVASARAEVGGNIQTWILRSWDPDVIELVPPMMER
jgi:hypothetical protein